MRHIFFTFVVDITNFITPRVRIYLHVEWRQRGTSANAPKPILTFEWLMPGWPVRWTLVRWHIYKKDCLDLHTSTNRPPECFVWSMLISNLWTPKQVENLTKLSKTDRKWLLWQGLRITHLKQPFLIRTTLSLENKRSDFIMSF